MLRVVDDSRHVAALSVTNDEVHGALVNLRGGLRWQAQLPLPSHNGQAVLEAIYGVIDQLVAAANTPLLGIGLNTPGLIDTSTGVVLRAVSFSWEDLPLKRLLQDRYRLPVYISNDSHSLALAEYMFGHAHDTPNLVVIKAGNGIGAGIVLNGHLFAGDGYGAGEIGHFMVEEHGTLCKCGNQGCLETVASTAVIAQRARVLAQADSTSALHHLAADPAAFTMDAIAGAARDGDAAMSEVITFVGRYLAIAVASLVSVLNVRRIVITGRVAPLGTLLRNAVAKELAVRALPTLVRDTVVEVTAMAPEAPLLGAATPLLTYELGLARLRRRA